MLVASGETVVAIVLILTESFSDVKSDLWVVGRSVVEAVVVAVLWIGATVVEAAVVVMVGAVAEIVV